MNVLDLFSGIGGFSLGLERAGMRTKAFCEIDPFCRAVLAKHWPTVPVFGDVRELTAEKLAAHANCGRQPQQPQCNGQPFSRKEQPSCGHNAFGLDIDVICGGFPCQDISVAGKGAGLAGERSGLWSEYARIIGQVRPRYAIIENVAVLASRGLERVLWDLWQTGYDAEWMCIRACDVGAPHIRDRIWIIAYPQRDALRHQPRWGNGQSRSDQAQSGDNGPLAREIANNGDAGRAQWGAEPDVGRVANGVPARVDRLRSLGNAIVPQIATIIGKAILEAEKEKWGLAHIHVPA